MVFITKARDINIMVKAKATDFCCPDVKAKAKDSFLKDFSRMSADYFIIYVGLKYTSSTLPYVVKRPF